MSAAKRERVRRLLEHYRSLGSGPELELFETLYRCLQLDARMKDPAR